MHFYDLFYFRIFLLDDKYLLDGFLEVESNVENCSILPSFSKVLLQQRINASGFETTVDIVCSGCE